MCVRVCARARVRGRALDCVSRAQNFWDEVFPTPKRSAREHRLEDDGEDGSHAGERQGEEEADGERRASSQQRKEAGEDRQDDVRSLGLPQGREEAVRISREHRTTSQASRQNLDDYFGCVRVGRFQGLGSRV